MMDDALRVGCFDVKPRTCVQAGAAAVQGAAGCDTYSVSCSRDNVGA